MIYYICIVSLLFLFVSWTSSRSRVELFQDFAESGADALRTGLVQHFGARPAARHVALSHGTLPLAQLVTLAEERTRCNS